MPPFLIPFRKALPMFMAAAASCLPGCSKPKKDGEAGNPLFQMPFAEEKRIDYPIERVISDVNGRPLEVVIVGRSGTELFVTKKSEPLDFTIPIANLAQADRDFANKLPEREAPAGFGKRTEPETELPYIKSREQEIAKLEKENLLFADELKASSNPMIITSRQRGILQNKAEIQKMQADIDRYKTQNGLN